MKAIDRFRAYIRQIQSETGLEPTTIAKRAKLAASTINRPLNDADYVGAPSLATIEKLEQAFGIPYESKPAHRPSSHQSRPSPLGALSAIGFDYGDQLPIVGGARGGDGGQIFFDQGTPMGFVPRPPGLLGVKDAFAVYVVGDSMLPKFEPGSIVHCNPHLPVTAGKFVVVQLDEQRAIVKQFVRKDDREIVLREFHPHPEELRFAVADVLAMYRVVSSQEP